MHSDIDEGRLNKAKELGADYIFKIDPTKDSRDIAKEIENSLGAADQTIECTGAESSFHTAIYVCIMGWYNVDFWATAHPPIP